MNFDNFYQSHYHRVSIGPNELATQSLVFSDIVLHLPVLEYYASLCEHVTEFGVREGSSTVALIAGCKGVVHSYDINNSPARHFLEAMELPCKWYFHQADTGDKTLDIEVTDMLFVDTLHTYEHVKKELAIHGRKARKYLAFHDTFTCGKFDISGDNPSAVGILPAIEEFLSQYPDEYRTVYRTDRNNGLWVLERVC
jgi:hypothetical protein